MIFGLLIRVAMEFLRRRGVPVPDTSRIRRRPPVLGSALTKQLVDRMERYVDERHASHPTAEDRDNPR